MLSNIYGLSNGAYLNHLMTVDNLFIRQLAVLCLEEAQKKKVLGVVTSSSSSLSNSSSIVDICSLPALGGSVDCSTLVDEVALYRGKMVGIENSAFISNNKEMLFLDYLLASCVCYVEVFDNGKVDKYFATRNRMLAGSICDKSADETRKYTNHLTPYESMYENNQLAVLKINMNKKGKTITQPRSYLDMKKRVKITPVFFLNIFMKEIMPLVESNLVKFTYIKDNLTEREFITTLSEAKISQYYDSDIVSKMLRNHEVVLGRGFIRLPEMGISKYDLSCVRSLNLSRITNVEVVDSFDTSYIDIDFSVILRSFINSINECSDINSLVHVYTELVGSMPENMEIPSIKNSLVSYMETQHTIGTTTLLRQLHSYMLGYPQIFKGYTGASSPMLVDMSGFSLGLE